MTDIKALIINCTLKRTPEKSNTELLADKVIAVFKNQKVETEIIRLVDYNISHGVSSDEGNGDQWPAVLEKIRQCDICIIAAPVWMGHSASTVQQIFERLDDAFYNDQLRDKKTGQLLGYNKVAGALVTGNEDGAHGVARHILWGLQEVGFTVPPNANSYWVGLAGGDKNYGDGDIGKKHYYTNKNNLYLAYNTVYFAKLLKAHPITTNLKELDRKAKRMSR